MNYELHNFFYPCDSGYNIKKQNHTQQLFSVIHVHNFKALENLFEMNEPPHVS